jgi:hypothetical protein
MGGVNDPLGHTNIDIVVTAKGIAHGEWGVEDHSIQ